MLDILSHLLAPIKRRVMLLWGRGILSKINDDTPLPQAQIKLLHDELHDQVDVIQHYGFASCPKAGAECVALFLGGNRDHGLIINIDDRRYRLKPLKDGEVALYTHEGDHIYLKRNNQIEINTKTLTINAENEVMIKTPSLKVTGDIQDQCENNSLTIKTMREKYNSHTHIDSQGGNTQSPQQKMS